MKNTNAPKFIWNGLYPTWHDAKIAAEALGKDGKGYQSDIWFGRITQQLTDYRKEFQRFGIAMPPRPCNLPLVCSIKKPTSIIDFGGSSGWCWDYLNNSIPENQIYSYTIVENLAVMHYMKSSGLQNEPVSYITLNDANSVDLLYLNAVLQYFENNEPLVTLIKKSNPKYILLDGLVSKEGEDFFTVQTFYDSGIAFRFIGLIQLLSDLQSLGFSPVFKGPYFSPFFGVIKEYEMSNFPEQYQLRYALTIFLERKD